VDGAPCHFPISFHISYSRSEPRTHFFVSNQMREGGVDVRGSVVALLDFNEKIVFQVVSAIHVQI
jgi:hypothetical protein